MKYNTMFDVAFTLIHEQENWEKIPIEDILGALQARINYLRNHIGEAWEALGHCDTYSIDD